METDAMAVSPVRADSFSRFALSNEKLLSRGAECSRQAFSSVAVHVHPWQKSQERLIETQPPHFFDSEFGS
jgi:hypothetical protein